jgi:DNA repair protein RadC
MTERKKRIIVRVSYAPDDPMLPAILRAFKVSEGWRELKAAGNLLNTPELVREYLQRIHGEDMQEQTGALFLNARNRLLRHDPDIYRGTLDRAVVEPREILKRALLCDAAGVIVYHNHPSGDPAPSREDREFTRRLATAADLVGIRLLDHLVVSAAGSVSFREAGLL